jgi:hypothetical protein
MQLLYPYFLLYLLVSLLHVSHRLAPLRLLRALRGYESRLLPQFLVQPLGFTPEGHYFSVGLHHLIGFSRAVLKFGLEVVSVDLPREVLKVRVKFFIDDVCFCDLRADFLDCGLLWGL